VRRGQAAIAVVPLAPTPWNSVRVHPTLAQPDIGLGGLHEERPFAGRRAALLRQRTGDPLHVIAAPTVGPGEVSMRVQLVFTEKLAEIHDTHGKSPTRPGSPRVNDFDTTLVSMKRKKTYRFSLHLMQRGRQGWWNSPLQGRCYTAIPAVS
jgi:hypothetical protein